MEFRKLRYTTADRSIERKLEFFFSRTLSVGSQVITCFDNRPNKVAKEVSAILKIAGQQRVDKRACVNNVKL